MHGLNLPRRGTWTTPAMEDLMTDDSRVSSKNPNLSHASKDPHATMELHAPMKAHATNQLYASKELHAAKSFHKAKESQAHHMVSESHAVNVAHAANESMRLTLWLMIWVQRIVRC
ncbi:hypothetical protein QVD17_24446 [Tagetes erecta]|uniref:Uncharacterized protein n=1 Tax=Tagetes erecta TaxID=13708 RepID=A0AAD8KIM9_TARER|nr:hypothetical protein QVD17_24446 [Tagetes erecta]